MNSTNDPVDPATRWWEHPAFLLAIVLATALPLLWPEIPPLVDLPGHIGRYRVELDLQSSPELQRYYQFKWALIGNLGVDLLVIPLAKLIGLEPAVKVIVALIPPLTTLGIFAVAREVHGRVPPTAFFAVPFVYGQPFNYGFVNFSLAIGLALLAFALWLRLSRPGKLRLRALLFVPLSCALWLVHVFGWGLLGLLAFSAEAVRFREQRIPCASACGRAAMQMIPLCIPFLLMMIWRSGSVGGKTMSFMLLGWKLSAIVSALRDRWLIWDALSVAMAFVLIGAGMFDRQLEFSRRIGIPAGLLGLTFVALPYMLFGSANADMRLAPYVIVVTLLAIRFRGENLKLQQMLAILGLVFVVLRLAGNTISFAIAGSEQREISRALDHVPRGAAVLTLASGDCDEVWRLGRHWHLGALVISRRYGFSNDQWQLPGAQLLSVRYQEAAPFQDHRSALVFTPKCVANLKRRGVKKIRTTQQSLDEFPREAFDYVWLIKPHAEPLTPSSGLSLVWKGRDSLLYRVTDPRL